MVARESSRDSREYGIARDFVRNGIEVALRAPTPTREDGFLLGWTNYTEGMTVTGNTEILTVWHIHDYEEQVILPTCTERGYTTSTCLCGDSFVDSFVDQTSHTEEILPGKAATCTDTGLTDGVTCTVCGETLTAQETVAALGHTEETVAGKAATCTEAGLTEGKKCSVCGEILTAQEPIAALGHTASDWIVDIEPTPGVDGSKHRTCVVCQVVLETTVIEALPKETEEETETENRIENDTTADSELTVETSEDTDSGVDDNVSPKSGCFGTVQPVSVLLWMILFLPVAVFCRKKETE